MWTQLSHEIIIAFGQLEARAIACRSDSYKAHLKKIFLEATIAYNLLNNSR